MLIWQCPLVGRTLRRLESWHLVRNSVLSLQKSGVTNLDPRRWVLFFFHLFFLFQFLSLSAWLALALSVSVLSLKLSVALCLCFLIDSSGDQCLQQEINTENNDSKQIDSLMNADQLGEETEYVLGQESDIKPLCEYRNASHYLKLLLLLATESQVQVSQQNHLGC